MAPMRSKDGPTWFDLFKTNRALKKCLRKKKRENKVYIGENNLLLNELNSVQEERDLFFERNKELEKTTKPTIKIVEKVVYLNQKSVLTPVMIHLLMFWLMNVLFSNHLVSMGIDDIHAIQFGVFVLNAMYVCIVGYVISLYDM